MTSVRDDGTRVHIVHNWAWQPCAATAPVPLSDALAQQRWDAGDFVDLGPWDVRVLVEAPGAR